MKVYLKIFLLISLRGYCQDVTISSIFNDLYRKADPENRLLTRSDKIALREKHRIKEIVIKKLGGERFFDSLVLVDPVKGFVENHMATVEYFRYTQNGLIEAYSVSPLNARLNPIDSVNHKKVIVKGDNESEYIVEYYLNNEHYKTEIYKDSFLLRTTEKQAFRLSYSKHNIQKDTFYKCDNYIYYSYNVKGLIIQRLYNNSQYHNPDSLCNIKERESYKYNNDQIIIEKYPHKEESGDNEKYLNKVDLNKRRQIVHSTFYMNTFQDPFILYTCSYDDNGNLKAIYESYNMTQPYQRKLFEYENLYDNHKSLVSITESCPGYNMTYDKLTYYFDKEGLIYKMKYHYGQDSLIKLISYTRY